MNDCDKCTNPCNPCERGCKPARYSRGFTDNKCTCEETDTSLSIDYSGATLNYKAEKHTDKITGKQLGSIINLPDLRDVNIDYDFNAMCAEFIYHKFGECGDGCKSLEDSWNLFSIDQDGAKKDAIRYVRGANAYGCPEYLDVPSNLNEWWLAGWRLDGDHKQFGYFQPTPQPEIDGSVMWVGPNGQINSSPMVSASNKIYNTYCRGNSAFQGGYYYPANSVYDVHIAPNSIHGMVTGSVSGQPTDATVSNLNQDVVAIIHWCDDYTSGPQGRDTVFLVTAYNSQEEFDEEMEKARASHFETVDSDMAVPASSSLVIPKGSHLVLHVNGSDAAASAKFRLHQVRVTWIPANLVSTVDEIIQ